MLVAIVLLVAYSVLAICFAVSRRCAVPAVFLVFGSLAFGCFAAARWTSICLPDEIGVDESQNIAQALRCAIDASPWTGFVGGSHGPLNTYVLLWPWLLGLTPSFAASRLTAVFLLTTVVVGSLGVAVASRQTRLAGLSVLPMVVFLTLARDGDFLCYQGEMLPAAAANAVFAFILATFWQPRLVFTGFAGILIGGLPFMKLQFGPAAVFLEATAVAALLWNGKTVRHYSSTLAAHVTVLGLTSMVIPLALCLPRLFNGDVFDIWVFYIKYGVSYASGRWSDCSPWAAMTVRCPEFGVFLGGSVAASILLACQGIQRRNQPRPPMPAEWAVLSFAAANTCVAAILATWPRTGFNHYLLMLLGPASNLLIASLAMTDRSTNEACPITASSKCDRLRPHASVVIVCLLAFSQTALAIHQSGERPTLAVQPHPVVALLARERREKDNLFVWGHTPRLHILTGMPPAARFVVNTPSRTLSPDTFSLYADRLRKDLAVSRPRFVVDTTGELTDGLRGNLRLLTDVEAMSEHDYRLRWQISLPGEPLWVYRVFQRIDVDVPP